MRLYCVVPLFRFRALAPVLQGNPNGGTVSVARETQEAEAGDRSTALDTRGTKRHLLNLFANGDCAVQRSGKGQLNIDIQITLVLFRKEAGGEFFAEYAGSQCDEDKKQYAKRGFVDQHPAGPDVTIG